ncbi:7-carboxy-7-deazaguanine synthase QueE [Streptomyces sp. NBC_01020]|uniref:7-carboxy-7-deazaguanine synthase QueE n=1 Tax=unclassified Streptomyces TaxID=2593676 RepID=UPI00324821BE|nr:7-carboxy-7-deazaguanine synthase QueE [Streptomyces sp. NBC_01020]WSX71920.1 7-carboxy-7-deazaguanine synthase QueE [Streptomyces sp. NBC_00932]
MRLGGCNLSCRWCDTPYTWDWQGKSDTGIAYDPKKELHRSAVPDVAEKLLAFGVGLIVVSGGEPLSQQARLVPLIDILTGHGIEIEFETNGTRVPDPRLIRAGVRFNVSPKLSHSGDPERARIVPTALRRFATLPEATFKFVCRTEADLDEVAELVSAMGITSVWIMPEGQDPQHVSRHMQDLAASVIERGWNITTRLHTLLWGQKRGV